LTRVLTQRRSRSYRLRRAEEKLERWQREEKLERWQREEKLEQQMRQRM
jgi:hypothetical protein